MKVKVIKQFKDKYTNEVYKVGKTLTVSKERCEEILTVGKLVEVVEEKKAAKKPAKEETAE